MKLSRLGGGVLGLALASMISGCIIAAAPPVRTGTVTVSWTLSDSTSPSQCFAFGARDFELSLFDDAGRPVTVATAPCARFTITVPLPAGVYSANATLLDAAGNSATRTLPIRDITIVPGSDLAIDTDFPAGSRL